MVLCEIEQIEKIKEILEKWNNSKISDRDTIEKVFNVIDENE